MRYFLQNHLRCTNLILHNFWHESVQPTSPFMNHLVQTGTCERQQTFSPFSAFLIPDFSTTTNINFMNKISAVAEMGDRLATGGRKVGGRCGPFRGRVGSPSNTTRALLYPRGSLAPTALATRACRQSPFLRPLTGSD